MQHQFILSILFVLCGYFHILIPNAQEILNPVQRAAQLMMNFSQLPLLEYGEQCANMEIMRKDYVEGLLEIEALNDSQVVDSIAIYNRWVQNGGYRCNPAKYKCQKIPDGTLWTCRCPADIGQQKVNEVKSNGVVTGCQYDPTTNYGKPMSTDSTDCNKIQPPSDIPTLPESYDKEIVCGTFNEYIVNVKYNNSKIRVIDFGLHYNEILCPSGQRCLIKEFDAPCTVDNINILRDKWIEAGKFLRVNRLDKWPPCTCSTASVKSLTDVTTDPREDEVDALFDSISKAKHKAGCNQDEIDLLKKCARTNWYLFPEDLKQALRNLFDKYKAGNAGPNCDESKGLECKEKICTCKRTPHLPGYSPEYPLTVNSEGYCQLDAESDCNDFDGRGFRCPDGYNCLVDRYNVTCTEENVTKANSKKMKGKEETFLRRCLCSNSPVETELKDIDKKGPIGQGKGAFGTVCNMHLILAMIITTASIAFFIQ